jgi:23S rRNA (adenine2503-C2)-methyltransferase
MNEKLFLTGLFPEEIVAKLDLGANFRGKQIFKWISSGVSSFDEMTNLSLSLREKLNQEYTICNFNIISPSQSHHNDMLVY